MEASVARIANREGGKRVVVYECCPSGDMSVASLLECEGRRVVSCQDGKTFLDEVVAHRPDAIIAVLQRECQGDFGILHLLRRIAPSVPVIVVASDATLAIEKVARDLQPFYYTIAPVDMDEISGAVGAALEHRKP